MKLSKDILTPAEQIHYNIGVCRKGFVLVWRGMLGMGRGMTQIVINQVFF